MDIEVIDNNTFFIHRDEEREPICRKAKRAVKNIFKRTPKKMRREK